METIYRIILTVMIISTGLVSSTLAATICTSPNLSSVLTTERDAIPATASHPEIPYRVVYPENYDPTDTSTQYPVIYVLHGNGTNVNAESILTNILIPAANHYQCAVEAGLMEPSILVLPQGGNITSMWGDVYPGIHCPRGNNEFRDPNQACQSRTNVDGNLYQIESSVMNILIPHIEETLNVIPLREKRALLGFSMGGFGSMLYAMKYPETFSCAISLDGALHTSETLMMNRAGVFESFYNNDLNYFRHTSIYRQAERYAEWVQSHPNETVQFRLGNGALGFQADFTAHLESLNIPFISTETGNSEHSLSSMLRLEPNVNFEFINACFGNTAPEPVDWQPDLNSIYHIKASNFSLFPGGGGANMVEGSQADIRAHSDTAVKMQWIFEAIGDTGKYYIRSNRDTSFYLTANTTNLVTANQFNNTESQEWIISGQSADSIKLLSVSELGLALSVDTVARNEPAILINEENAITWNINLSQ